MNAVLRAKSQKFHKAYFATKDPMVRARLVRRHYWLVTKYAPSCPQLYAILTDWHDWCTRQLKTSLSKSVKKSSRSSVNVFLKLQQNAPL